MISLIVAAYNAEKTLGKLLHSLLQQDADLEVLVINDGSTDGTATIASDYARTHPFIRLIDLPANGGVSRARNVGIENATGDFIGFCDADDSVKPNAYTVMEAAFSEDVDLVVCSAFDRQAQESDMRTLSHDEFVSGVVSCPDIAGYPWNKLFRGEIIKSTRLRFHEDIFDMEDKLFVLEYLNSSHGKCVFIGQALYSYNLTDGSGRYSPERYETGLDACEKIMQLNCVSNNQDALAAQQAITAKHCVQKARVLLRAGLPIDRCRRLGGVRSLRPSVQAPYGQAKDWSPRPPRLSKCAALHISMPLSC